MKWIQPEKFSHYLAHQKTLKTYIGVYYFNFFSVIDKRNMSFKSNNNIKLSNLKDKSDNDGIFL